MVVNTKNLLFWKGNPRDKQLGLWQGKISCMSKTETQQYLQIKLRSGQPWRAKYLIISRKIRELLQNPPALKPCALLHEEGLCFYTVTEECCFSSHCNSSVAFPPSSLLTITTVIGNAEKKFHLVSSLLMHIRLPLQLYSLVKKQTKPHRTQFKGEATNFTQEFSFVFKYWSGADTAPVLRCVSAPRSTPLLNKTVGNSVTDVSSLTPTAGENMQSVAGGCSLVRN